MPVWIFRRFRVFLRALSAAALCALAVTSQASNNNEIRVKVVEGVDVLLPSPWFLANRTKNAVEIAYPRSTDLPPVSVVPGQKPATAEEMLTAEARTVVLVEARLDHVDAVSRLAQIAAGRTERVQWTVVSGWPGIIREYRAPLPAPGESTPQGESANLVLHLSISLAVESMVIRLETVLAPGADPKLLEQALAIAHQVQVKAGDPKAAQRDVSRLNALSSN
jgi:hypothetical protein